MKNKWNRLALCSFVISIGIFVFTYLMYHHLGADGKFVLEYFETPTKPFVTFLFGVWGTFFLFASVMSILVGKIFSSKSGAE